MLDNENKLGIVTIANLCFITIIISLSVVFDASGSWIVIAALFVVGVVQAASLIIYARNIEKQKEQEKNATKN